MGKEKPTHEIPIAFTTSKITRHAGVAQGMARFLMLCSRAIKDNSCVMTRLSKHPERTRALVPALRGKVAPAINLV
jgi:hypothetical protein